MGRRLLTATEKVWRFLFRYQQKRSFGVTGEWHSPNTLPTLNIKRELIGSKTLHQIECHYSYIG